MELLTNYNSAIENIREDLRSYLKEHPIKSLVLGISGCIDSALVAALVKPVCDEFKIPLIGRYISIETNKEDEAYRARFIGKHYCNDFEIIDLTKEYLAIKDIDLFEAPSTDDERSLKIRMCNIKARLRMIYLYNIASGHKGMVLSTDNYTELMLGFWTLHGDVGDYGPIQQLWKTEVYEMTKFIADRETFERAEPLYLMLDVVATDGLGITKSDLDQILPNWRERHETTRSGYKEVDEILYESLHGKGFSVTSPQWLVIKRHLDSAFKRSNPYNTPRTKIVKL